MLRAAGSGLTPRAAALLLAAIPLAGPAGAAQSVDAPPREPEIAIEPAPAARAGDLEVHYVANEGFLVEGAGRRVLVDALFGAGVTGYPVASPDTRRHLELGTGGWGGVDVALASHHHADHFHPEAVARFLASNPQAVFVSTPQAVELLRPRLADDAALGRVRAVLPMPGAIERLEIRDVIVDVLHLHHGERSPPVDNLGFVVTLGDRRFLHFGDTEAKMADFEPYLELLRETDLALLPFWFLSSEWRAAMVRDHIRPHRIVVAHLPLPTAPSGHFARWRSWDNLVRVIRSAFPDAVFPDRTGTRVGFPDP